MNELNTVRLEVKSIHDDKDIKKDIKDGKDVKEVAEVESRTSDLDSSERYSR